MKSYIVYCHTLNKDGRKYIGITGNSTTNRWSNGKGYKHNKYFTNAINKYGWDNFSHKVLFTNLTKEEAEKIEVDLIAKYKTQQRKYGFNSADGGGVNTGWHHSKSSKERIAKGQEGRVLTDDGRKRLSEFQKGKKLSLETRKKLSLAHKGKPVNEEQKKAISIKLKGHSISDEAREKMIQHHLGKKLSKSSLEKRTKTYLERYSYKVLCVETGEIFPSLKEAQNKYNAKSSHISEVCKGKRQTAYGYHWKKIK